MDPSQPQPHAEAETIELGGFHLLDEMNGRWSQPDPSRGLLVVPPEVDAAVAEDYEGS